MEDFNNYAKNFGKNGNGNGTSNGSGTSSGGLFETVTRLARQFDGKSQTDLVRAIYAEAEKGKRAGTLSDADIDNFVALLSPVLDEKKRKYLKRIAQDLKKI